MDKPDKTTKVNGIMPLSYISYSNFITTGKN